MLASNLFSFASSSWDMQISWISTTHGRQASKHLYRLAIHQLHTGCMVAITANLSLLKNPLNLIHLLIRQLHGTRILRHALGRGGAGDGYDPRHARAFRQRQMPAKCQLSWGAILRFGDLLELMDELDVVFEVFGREAGKAVAHVVFGDVGVLLDLAGQDAFADGGVAVAFIYLLVFLLVRLCLNCWRANDLRENGNVEFGTGLGNSVGQGVCGPE